MEYTAVGHTVGLARRMEALAEPGRAYLTEHTARLVEGYFRLRDLGGFNVKGARDPVGVSVLEGIGALRSAYDVARSRGLSRLVGRAEEMAALESALARAAAGNGQVVGVVGEAGRRQEPSLRRVHPVVPGARDDRVAGPRRLPRPAAAPPAGDRIPPAGVRHHRRRHGAERPGEGGRQAPPLRPPRPDLGGAASPLRFPRDPRSGPAGSPDGARSPAAETVHAPAAPRRAAERAGDRGHPAGGPPLVRPRQHRIPGAVGGVLSRHENLAADQLPAGVPRRLDAPFVLPPASPRHARRRCGQGTARRTPRHGQLAPRTLRPHPQPDGRQPVLRRGGRPEPHRG